MIDFKKHCGYGIYENNFWHIMYFICHPIKCFNNDRNTYPSLVSIVLDKYYKFLNVFPLTKPARFAARCLTYWIKDVKILDDRDCFYVRTRGKNTYYYMATAHFGHVKFYRIKYVRNGKHINTFMDFTVGGLVDSENAKKKAQETKIEKIKVFSKWVFTKKQAMNLCKKYIEIMSGMYGRDTFFAEDSFYIDIVCKIINYYLNNELCENIKLYDGDTFYNDFNAAKTKEEKVRCLILEYITWPYFPEKLKTGLCLSLRHIDELIYYLKVKKSNYRIKNEYSAGMKRVDYIKYVRDTIEICIDNFCNEMNKAVFESAKILPEYKV